MLYPAKWSNVLMGWILGILVAGSAWLGFAPIARAAELSIRFDELEAYAQAESPRAQIMLQELVKAKAEREDALQWSNPEIAYDHENIESSREWQITLRKQFLSPLSHSKLRNGWDDRIRSAEYQRDQGILNLLADFKTGYVRMRLLDAYLTQLAQLEEIVTKAAITAEARHKEGELSGVEKHLIQLSALSLDAHRRNAMQDLRELAAIWKADLGIPTEDEVRLATTIRYEPVHLLPVEKYLAALERQPAIQSKVALQQALSKHTEAAKPSIIPGIGVYAGYKQIDPDLDGFVGGIALTLPIFDRKAGAARQLAAEQRIVENNLKLYRTRTAEEIKILVTMITDAQAILSTISAHLEEDTSVIESLFYSYQEGHYTLNAFLNAIQIEVTGSGDYYDQLHAYYQNIFRLEAITGTEIVSFDL
jgi:outer membrane protein TolC